MYWISCVGINGEVPSVLHLVPKEHLAFQVTYYRMGDLWVRVLKCKKYGCPPAKFAISKQFAEMSLFITVLATNAFKTSFAVEKDSEAEMFLYEAIVWLLVSLLLLLSDIKRMHHFSS